MINGSRDANFHDLRFIRAINRGARDVRVRSKVHLIRGDGDQFRRHRLRCLIALLFATTRAFIRTAINRLIIRLRGNALLTRRLRRLANQRDERVTMLTLLVRDHARRIRRQRTQGLCQDLREGGSSFVYAILEARNGRILTVGNG